MTPTATALKKTDKQREAIELLAGPATNILLYGGARSGKTFILLYAMAVRALKAMSRHLILRLHFNHVKTSVWYDTLPKVLDLACPGLLSRDAWNKSDFFITFPNGSEIWIGGLDDKLRTEKILGTEYSTIFFNECSQLTYASTETALSRLAEKSGLVNRAYYDCNPPHKKHWAHRVFMENVYPTETNEPLVHPEDYTTLLINPEDNRENLPEDYIGKTLGGLSKRQRDRFLHGLWLDLEEGALWKYDWIKRAEEPSDGGRIVVSVDPEATVSETSSETGIIVAKRVGDNLYVLEDASGKFTPKGWANVAVNAFFRHHADRIIGEVNNGGDMVESTVRQINPDVPYKAVRASRGKARRAEPISALYEQGRGFHCGNFPELEDQMCGWIPPLSGQKAEYSPDRMDALVWAATELMEGSRVIALESIDL